MPVADRQYALGNMLLKGLGTEVDEARAFTHFKVSE